MYFQILKLVLWPRRGGKPRIVKFEPGVVNVISGASKTGKSAVIPIIDYCLGADKCTIPVGVIREECSWFGVLVETAEGQKLFARREPIDQKSTGDMYIDEGSEVEIPQVIESKNSNVETMKASLDRLAGLSGMDFDPLSDNSFKSRISFRDLVAFVFQPQNIVANPDVLFYKADTTEHREKLKTIFPYVLDAITPRILAVRQQLELLERQLRRKEVELRSLMTVANQWMSEARTLLQQAIEHGLSPADEIPVQWPDLLDRLRAVVANGAADPSPSMDSINSTLDRLSVLRRDASTLAMEVTNHRQRLNDLRRLRESSESYGDAIRLQRDRLSLSSWLRTRAVESSDPLVLLEEGLDERVNALCDTLEEVEVQLRSYPFMSDALEGEMLRQRSITEEALAKLSLVRREIAAYEAETEERRKVAARFKSAERFLGALEQSIELYDQSDSTSPLQAEIEDLKRQIGELRIEVAETKISEHVNRAINKIQGLTDRIVPLLDAEWKDAPVRLNIRELTVQVTRGNREDYLWEVGSGANWLAYHVAITLALQLLFQTKDHHPVPALLIYDQPSQVYFPKRTSQTMGDATEDSWKDQDVLAVRKVFQVLARAVTTAKAKMQVIVLDHAHLDVWGNIDQVYLCEEWRDDKKLVPIDWLQDLAGGDSA